MYLSDDSTSDYSLLGWLKQQNKILPHISTHGGNVVLPAHGGSDLPLKNDGFIIHHEL